MKSVKNLYIKGSSLNCYPYMIGAHNKVQKQNNM
jgi:hypothetical protein